MLYLVGVPAVVVAVIWALAYRGGSSAEKRYRPGRPYQFTPVWYLANHQGGQPQPEGRDRPALPAPDRSGDSAPLPVGGASERW